jgi:hypothetical protein
MLVNGKSAANLIKRDLNNLHEIIKSTTINGASVNIQNTNDLLAKQLEDVIHSMNIGTNGMQATVNDEMNDLTEKCFKCLSLLTVCVDTSLFVSQFVVVPLSYLVYI